MKNWLRAQPHQPATLAELQTLLDTFAGIYNTRRPHRSLAGPRDARRRLRRPAQGRPRRPGRRHPRPRPHRPHRHHRTRHPPAQRPSLPHRHRPAPRRNPRPDARPGPARPRHQRRHRRAHPRARPGPRQVLPAHRQTTRLAKENTAALTRVHGVLDVLRHHTCAPGRIRTRDPLLRRPFHAGGQPDALLTRAGLLIVRLQPNVSGFRHVLARGWHEAHPSMRPPGAPDGSGDTASQSQRADPYLTKPASPDLAILAMPCPTLSLPSAITSLEGFECGSAEQHVRRSDHVATCPSVTVNPFGSPSDWHATGTPTARPVAVVSGCYSVGSSPRPRRPTA